MVSSEKLAELRAAVGITEELLELARQNKSDLSAAGYRYRLAAIRAAIRYRNPETGKRHHVHIYPYNQSVVRTIRWMRAEIKYQEQS